MAAEGVAYDEIVAATHICPNKSSLATILAIPIYRGVKVLRPCSPSTRVSRLKSAERGRRGRD